MKIENIVYHRNGVSGNGFHVVAFRTNDDTSGDRLPPMYAVVFPEKGNIAVLTVGDPTETWRGDIFETLLRDAIEHKA